MTRTVLFVCPHGAAKSRVAAAYFARVCPPDWLVTTAGQEPDAVLSPTAERLLAGEEAAAFLDYAPPRAIDAVPSPAHIVAIDCDVPGAATRWALRHRVFDELMRDELRDRAEGLALQLNEG
jgi:protein-tyrosine-phosphatase